MGAKDSFSRANRFLIRKPDGTTRSAQLMGLGTVFFLVIVSFALTSAFNQLLVDILLQNIESGAQLTIMKWLVTALTLMFFVGNAVGWFLWVRSGGFGFFKV